MSGISGGDQRADPGQPSGGSSPESRGDGGGLGGNNATTGGGNRQCGGNRSSAAPSGLATGVQTRGHTANVRNAANDSMRPAFQSGAGQLLGDSDGLTSQRGVSRLGDAGGSFNTTLG